MTARATTYLVVLCVLVPWRVAAGSDIDFPRFAIRVQELVATNWVVSVIGTQDKPYGWDQTRGRDSGLAVTLAGPETVRGAKGEQTKEALTIYVMPKEFVPVDLPPPGTPEFGSTFLGRTPHGHQVYVKVWTEIHTWKDWRGDIEKYFKIGANKPLEATR